MNSIKFPTELPILQLDQEYLDAMREFQSQQVIGDDPTDELLEIYQKRVLIDFSYLKAEKWYSPEHQNELKKRQASGEIGKEIPKNVINQNFVKLMALFNSIMIVGSDGDFDEYSCIEDKIKKVYQKLIDLVNFVKQFTDVKYQIEDVCIYEPLMDVRFCQNLTQYFNYLLTFKYMKLVNS